MPARQPASEKNEQPAVATTTTITTITNDDDHRTAIVHQFLNFYMNPQKPPPTPILSGPVSSAVHSRM